MSTGPDYPTRDAPYITPATLNEPRAPTDRFTTIRQTLADLEKAGHDCTWGREADLNWCVTAIDQLSAELSSWKAVAHDHSERLKEITADRDRLRTLINTPIIDDFLRALPLEAAHQQERWKAGHDAGKTPEDWFWLIGYLSGKACRHFEIAKVLANIVDQVAPENLSPAFEDHVRLQIKHHGDKALHHIITTAAACLNWHRHATGDATAMRPGIEPPTGSAS